MATQINLNTPLAPPLQLLRFSVEQYHHLAETGVLTPEDQVEFLEGWIVQKINHRPIHGFIVRLLTSYLMRELPAGWLCQCQLPITTEHSEPEPDIAIVQGNHADYRDRHPGGAECRLIIEVADTSLDKDRAKTSIYRTAGVNEYWIINVADQCVERYCFADPTTSTSPTIIHRSESLTLSAGSKPIQLELAQIFE